ncbi:HflK protein [Candidatus Terasakiella magnetica]|uniref:Protein HflK n=1 Tax=Candidatus Terasakiella magnetica TaxID=1867952 RepID=A0A1C3RH20_9PROT|nr:FtsH protease activity modulator HflK [Candidatus Terasakiella magnetica]SCA56502.1 HflK protein [Candidatus Terasakiella magnetica]
MSWNNQGGGPWGNGGNNQGPWGQGPKKPNGGGNGGGGPNPPDLEEMLRKSQENMKKFVPGGVGGGKLFALALIVILAVWIGSGFYKVKTDQQGVQLMFGKYVSSTNPGLHWNFPAPIGDVLTPRVTNVRKIEIGANTSTTRSRNSGTGESLMLTGDQNIADVEFAVLWNVKDAASFLFNIRDPETTVRAAAQSAMREVIGQMNLERVNTQGRGQIAQDAQELIQQILDDYKSGINVAGVELAKADPPQAVIEAFNDVQSARQDKERKQNEAEAYRNKIVPTARGEAQKLMQDAEAYKERVIKDAEGEAKRFISVYESYAANKDVTRERLYLETMQEVLKGSEKVIIDSEKGGSGVVPYLPLPELQKRKGAN